MRKALPVAAASALLGFYLLGSAYVGWSILPPLLLKAPLPSRDEAQRAAIRKHLASPGSRWENFPLQGGEGRALDIWRLRRPISRGAILFLHGFGDDAWGAMLRSADMPDWDAVGFTFRGRDRHPEVPCTLGGWERQDVTALVTTLERQGLPRSRMVLAAWSQGAGVALLALAELERQGGPLGGALLECPFENIQEAAKNHLRLGLGPWEILFRPAEALALARAGHQAGFKPSDVSPVRAALGLKTPIALITGSTDSTTPLPGVLKIAKHHPDLTIVPGAGHCEASGQVEGGWKGWAQTRLETWGLDLLNRRSAVEGPSKPAPQK